MLRFPSARAATPSPTSASRRKCNADLSARAGIATIEPKLQRALRHDQPPLDLWALLTYPELAPAVRADRTFNDRARGRWNEQLAIRTAFAAIWGISVASRRLRYLRRERRIRRREDDPGRTNGAGYSLQNRAPRKACRPHFLVV